MTSRPDAISSDLERARTLARRLRPEGLLPSARPPLHTLPSADYLRFEAAPPAPEPAPFHDRLADCLAEAGARAILVLGVDGRVIDVAGTWTSWPSGRLEAVGARLTVALGQAERLEGQWDGPRSIGIAVGADWIAGLRLTTPVGRLTVGLLVDRPLGQEALSAIVRILQPAR
jgi:hypothetical protein